MIIYIYNQKQSTGIGTGTSPKTKYPCFIGECLQKMSKKLPDRGEEGRDSHINCTFATKPD
jgi:hypothetical protein